jgi:hypothetical protein
MSAVAPKPMNVEIIQNQVAERREAGGDVDDDHERRGSQADVSREQHVAVAGSKHAIFHRFLLMSSPHGLF